MATISILANTVRPSVDCRSDDATFGAGTFSWQDPAHSLKAGPVEVITVIFFLFSYFQMGRQKLGINLESVLGIEIIKK